MLFITLLASSAAFLATATASSYGNFSLSCTDVDLTHNVVLNATCCGAPADGAVEPQLDHNELDLSKCIGLDQITGHMQWEVYGKFSNYCTNCTILQPKGKADYLLHCWCEPLVGSHGPVDSTINLDEGIANDMGTLKCAGGEASVEDGS
ncbi:hypothetical protein N658DRAFT_524805 [Parathielavia hyrcaniae]|uniref:Cyanovirin-N domain-containing protein n=1 Tax=Parathielavia hyrcaniae TaxID=113614 RepID=A0AAN6PZ11_9PEZI|nr:hypothetical protein N658DRAFT_524805 [Parathielavia hyrcaniae]